MKLRIVLSLLSLLVVFAGASKVQAQRYWIGVDGVWENGLNWNGGIVPSANETLYFSNAVDPTPTGGPVGPSGISITGGTVALTGIVFDYNGNPIPAGYPNPAYTIGGSGPLNITGAGAHSITVVPGVVANQTINAPINSSGVLTLNNQSTTSLLSLNGGVTGTTGITVNGVGRVSLGDSSTDTFGGNLTLGTASVASHLIGSGTVNGNVTVTNGTLGGNLIINGATVVADGATLSPGATSGAVSQLTMNALTFQNNSNFTWDGTGASVFDKIVLNNGALTVGTGLDFNMNFSGQTLAFGNSWEIFTGVSNTLAAVNALNTNALVSATNYTGPLGGMFSWTGSGSGVSLQFSAVPEPSSMVLLGVVGAIGGVVARRRRKK